LLLFIGLPMDLQQIRSAEKMARLPSADRGVQQSP